MPDHGHGHGQAETGVPRYHHADLPQRFNLDIVGERHHALLQEMTAIAHYQWSNALHRGPVMGFMLSGPPGVGKTTLAGRLTHDLGNRLAEGTEARPVSLMMIDGADIARVKYGESEARIRQIFQQAQGEGHTVLLLDDVESILMARGSANAKEWHFSQDSVFFHAVDELDTSRTVLVLTTNRPDLVDDAIRDRFLQYDLGLPELDLVVAAARSYASRRGLGDDDAGLESKLREAFSRGEVRSFRDAERFALRLFIEQILDAPSNAAVNSA